MHDKTTQTDNGRSNKCTTRYCWWFSVLLSLAIAILAILSQLYHIGPENIFLEDETYDSLNPTTLLFNHFDQDKDGSISIEEFKVISQQIKHINVRHRLDFNVIL